MQGHWKTLLITVLLISGGGVCPLSLTPIAPFGEVEIDYSAANEYFGAHYGYMQKTPYFGQDRRKEPIFDARQGFLDEEGVVRPPSLTSCGFALYQNLSGCVTDWNDLGQIKKQFLPQVRSVIQKAYPHKPILHYCFWNPMLRAESFRQTRPTGSEATTPTASYAASPHIDTDVNAYSSAEDLVSLFEKNALSEETVEFPRQELIQDIKEGRRFAIVNAWRNVASGRPVARAPLAFLSTRYFPNGAFPEASPDPKLSRWYTFPSMLSSELLLFCQYDRDERNPSDLWHCALTAVGDPDAPERESLDVRCLIVFEERVPVEFDRFRRDRPKSLLTQKQSAKFCSKQAQTRGLSA